MTSSLLPVVPRCEPEDGLGYFPNPWVEMPPGGQPFTRIDQIDTPAALGVETVVLQRQVPVGLDGVVLGIMNHFEGPGFVPGSGDLIWRIRIGLSATTGRPALGFGAIRTELGDFSRHFFTVYGGLLVSSNEFIVYTITHSIGSPIVPGGTRIFCGIAGYFWPRGEAVRRRT